MGSYYNSNSGVAWGMPTASELKEVHKITLARKQNKSPISTLSSASSHGSDYKDLPECNSTLSSIPTVHSDHKYNTSATSDYYTPDESMHRIEPNPKNQEFLEKMTQVINEGNIEFFSPHKQARDTIFTILQNSENQGIANIDKMQVTLLETSMMKSFNEEDDSPEDSLRSPAHISIDSTIEELSEEEEPIIISDESDLSMHEPQLEFFKKEVSSQYLQRKSQKDCNNRNLQIDTSNELDSETEYVDNIVQNETANEVSEDCFRENIKFYPFTKEPREFVNNKSFSQSFEAESEKDYMHTQDEAVSLERLSGVSQDSFIERDTEYEEFYEKHTIASGSVNKISARNSELDDFNDTLEEIEMVRKYGLDYQMIDEKSKESSPSINFSEDRILAGSFLPHHSAIPVIKESKPIKSTLKKFGYVHSPVADYIKHKEIFKIPAKPLSKTKPSPKPQTSSGLKNIVSPVGIYIKNSPAPVLQQNCVTKPSMIPMRCRFEPGKTPPRGKDNSGLTFPQVIYKGAKSTVESAKRDVVLPGSLNKFVKEAMVTAHGRRVRKENTEVERRLLQEEVSMQASNLNETENVSFLTHKQAFIK